MHPARLVRLEESAHRYGGRSRPRRSLPGSQDFSEVLAAKLAKTRDDYVNVDLKIKHWTAASQVTLSHPILILSIFASWTATILDELGL